MSDDDRLDYRQMFPAEGRNRKRYAENPRKPKELKRPHGFFKLPPTIGARKKGRAARPELGKRYDDAKPTQSMEKQIKMLVAKDLNRSAKSIAAELDNLGYEAAPKTVSVIRQDMIAILELCRRYGSINVPAWGD
ncbi:hypothetical protein ABIB83_006482 [Bradyrhizobium sp. I1.8.5]|uniref:hypothetical protein n=1 Tax=Bradyrhizobium sp. I1.8.5 TaxID=3156365 RepID=UPI00339953E0